MRLVLADLHCTDTWEWVLVGRVDLVQVVAAGMVDIPRTQDIHLMAGIILDMLVRCNPNRIRHPHRADLG